MRLSTILFGALALAPGALSVGVQKSVLVTYDRQTPSVNSMVDRAKDEIVKAGGMITHTFQFINGFHAIVAEDVVNSIQTWGSPYVTIEEDREITISGDN